MGEGSERAALGGFKVARDMWSNNSIKRALFSIASGAVSPPPITSRRARHAQWE